MIRRHARGTIPCFSIPRGIICMGTWRTWFYMHQVRLAYIAVFARRSSNPGPPIRSWGLYRLDKCDPRNNGKFWHQAFLIKHWNGRNINLKMSIYASVTSWKLSTNVLYTHFGICTVISNFRISCSGAECNKFASVLKICRGILSLRCDRLEMK